MTAFVHCLGVGSSLFQLPDLIYESECVCLAHLCCKLKSCLGDGWRRCLDGKQFSSGCIKLPFAFCHSSRWETRQLVKKVSQQSAQILEIYVLLKTIMLLFFFLICGCSVLLFILPVQQDFPLISKFLSYSAHLAQMLGMLLKYRVMPRLHQLGTASVIELGFASLNALK